MATLALGTFAQERDRMRRNGRGPRRDRTQESGRARPNPDAKLHRFSTTVEKERPQLNQETKDLIAAYRRDPSDANRAAKAATYRTKRSSTPEPRVKARSNDEPTEDHE